MKNKIFFPLLFLSAFFARTVYSKTNVDSLEKALPSASGKSRLEILGKLIDGYSRSNPNKRKEYFLEFEKTFLAEGEPAEFRPSYYHNKGEVLMRDGKYNEAITALLSGANYSTESKRFDLLWKNYNSLGACYHEMADMKKSLEYFLKALEVAEQHLEEGSVAGSAINLGVIYGEQEQWKEALKYFRMSLHYHEKFEKSWGHGNCLNNIGQVHKFLGNMDSAHYYYGKAMNVWEKIPDEYGMSMTNYNIGELHLKEKQYAIAEKYFLKSHAISEKIGDQYGITQNLSALSAMYFEWGKDDKGIEFLEKSIDYSKKNNILELVKDNFYTEYKYFKRKNDFKNALRAHEDFFFWYDSLNNAQKRKNVQELQSKFETEKKEKEIEKQKAEIASQNLMLSESRNKMLILAGGLAIVFVMAVFIFMNLRQKQKANKEISRQKEEIEMQKKIVEEKNKDITDSINYSRRIQEAMLPAKEIKYRIFPNAFVLFQPRDVVSGDFYWFAEKNGRRLIAAVDCTGHGVPGSLMSMIGITFLNEIVNTRGITRPDAILSELRHRVIAALKQTGAEGEQKDGMDMALLSFDDQNNVVEFAGAHNPLVRFRKENGSFVLQEFKADKRPIGYFRGEGLPFTCQTIDLKKGDTFYIFSDGYADQFGGEKGKKLKYKNFLQILQSVQEEPINEQEKTILNNFRKWKGSLEQIDDVLVIGLRV